MDFQMLNKSLSNLACEPFCFGEIDVFNQAYTYTQSLDYSFYFHGVNDDILASSGTSNAISINNKKDDFDGVDAVAANFAPVSLDYLLHGENVPKESFDHSFKDDSSISTPTGSPVSSISSLDDLNYQPTEQATLCEDALTSHTKCVLSSRSVVPSDDASFVNMLFPDVLMAHDTTIKSMDPDPECTSKSGTTGNGLDCGGMLQDADTNLCWNTPSPQSTDSVVSSSSLEDFSDLSCDLILAEHESDVENKIASLSKLLESDSSLPESVPFFKNEKKGDNNFSTHLPSEIHRTHLPSCPHRNLPYKRKQKTEEQKVRKKAHNRKSAARYRTKKAKEASSIFSQAELLEKKNQELKLNVEDLRKEVDYLKNLMLDVVKSRLSKQNATELENVLSGLVK